MDSSRTITFSYEMLPSLGWELLSQLSQFHYFSNFSEQSKHCLPV